MSSRRFLWLAGLVLVVALAVPAIAEANEVTKWNQIATNTLVAFPGPGGGAPPALQINMGMTQGAVYAAVNAIERRHRPIVLMKKFNSKASKEAAVATAASFEALWSNFFIRTIGRWRRSIALTAA